MEGPERTELPDPGTELETMCANARRVASLCDVLGIEFRGSAPLTRGLEREIAAGRETVGDIELEDGAWILPEEID